MPPRHPSISAAVCSSPRLKTLKLMSYVHQGYVARFQSVTRYFERSMDLLDPAVRDDLFNPARPIRTKDRSSPSTYYGPMLSPSTP